MDLRALEALRAPTVPTSASAAEMTQTAIQELFPSVEELAPGILWVNLQGEQWLQERGARRLSVLVPQMTKLSKDFRIHSAVPINIEGTTVSLLLLVEPHTGES